MSVDIPSPFAGTIKQVSVAVGDKISEGSKLGVVETSDSTAGSQPPAKAQKTDSSTEPPAKAQKSASSTPESGADVNAEVVVLGAGPGGYTAAFRAADLGKKVVLIERYDVLGGVCLNVGCIPSKALLHTAQIINEADHMKANGVTFGKPKIDLAGINGFKNKVVGKLTGGLSGLAKQRKVTVVHGVAEFIDQNNIQVDKGGVATDRDTVVSK
jgi:dihydrolipoamide dehydrogenase